MPKKKPTTGGKKDLPKVTRPEFELLAQPVVAKVGENSLVVEPREFHSGSFGWAAIDKVLMYVDGVPVRCQLTINVIVIGSKNLPGGVADPTI